MSALDPVGIVEIAERLNVKRATVDTWRSRGILPAATWIVGGRPAWDWKLIAEWDRVRRRAAARTEFDYENESHNITNGEYDA